MHTKCNCGKPSLSAATPRPIRHRLLVPLAIVLLLLIGGFTLAALSLHRQHLTFGGAAVLYIVLLGFADLLLRRTDAGIRAQQAALQANERHMAERQQAEERLLAKKQKLAFIIEGSRLGTWMWNVQTNETVFNATWAAMLGYTLEELTPTTVETWTRLTHPDDLQRAKKRLAPCRTGEVSEYECELRMRHKDGHWVWVLDRGRVMTHDADGKPLLMFGTHDDITGRKRSEKALRESESRLRAITDSTQDAILVMDPRGTISYWNPAAETLLGYAAGEAIGRDLHQLLTSRRYLAAYHAASAEFARTGRGGAIGKTLELPARRKDGQEITVALSLSAVSLHGEWHAVGVLRDITEAKRMEQALRDANTELAQTVEALESANKTLEQFTDAAEAATLAKSEFLANMSHEIRTPMTAILGFADVLLGEPDLDRAPPHRIAAIQTIRRNGKYLLDLINDILDLSKIEAGKLDVERAACSLGEVLGEVLTLMRVRADAKNLPLRLEYATDIPEAIECDALRLRQILINLVGNAIKFTETGSVRIVASMFQSLGKSAMLRIDVIDTGIGLTAGQASRLFQPFSQADSSTTRRFGGTGLGLVISKRLAEMLGGDIVFHSEAGKGSTFSVLLEAGDLEGVKLLTPSKQATAPAKPAPTADAASSVRLDGRILLAEDGPDNQRLISFVLEKAGAEVTVADNGRIACDKALAACERGEPFDLILMDMQMPVMDGYEATKRLRAAGYTGTILALTAHVMAGDDVKCRNAGCDGYLTKPIDRAVFLPAVAEQLKSNATYFALPRGG